MLKLGEGGPGNHGANFAEGSVIANTARIVGHAQPDASAGALDGAGERAVVDDFATNALDSTDAIEGAWTNENVASARRGGFAIAPAHPTGRIEHEEEKYESRDQQCFGQRAASQLYHE